MAAERTRGTYWVLEKGIGTEWEAAKWDGQRWQFFGDGKLYTDTEVMQDIVQEVGDQLIPPAGV